METSNYARFFEDCIAVGHWDDQGLTEDQIYGVYLSWCTLRGHRPTPYALFQAAVSLLGHHKRRRINGRYVWPGLRMTGPAALDYILTSRPSLV